MTTFEVDDVAPAAVVPGAEPLERPAGKGW
jgi:hypothetical protein